LRSLARPPDTTCVFFSTTAIPIARLRDYLRAGATVASFRKSDLRGKQLFRERDKYVGATHTVPGVRNLHLYSATD
jgi:hypothetical protein